MADTQKYLMRPSSALAPGTELGPATAITEEIMVFFVDCTVAAGGGNLVVKFQSKDPLSGLWTDLPGATATITAVTTNRVVPTVGFVPDVDLRYNAVATTGTYTFTVSALGKSFN